jgi:hypothetical protein
MNTGYQKLRLVLGKKGKVWRTDTGYVYVQKQELGKIRFTVQSKYRNVIIDIENKMYARVNTPRGEELLVPVGYA